MRTSAAILLFCLTLTAIGLGLHRLGFLRFSQSTIVVAAKDIAEGEFISPAMVRTETWPRDKVVSGTIVDLDDATITIARQSIYEGEPVLAQKLGLAAGRGGGSKLPRGYRGASFEVDPEVLAEILPGQYIDVVRSRGPDKAPETIVENRQVYFVADAPTGGTTITLLVTVEEKEMLVKDGYIGGGLVERFAYDRAVLRCDSGDD